MPIVPKLADRLKDRDAALKQQKELLSRIGTHMKGVAKPAKPKTPEQPAVTLPQPKVAAVRMRSDAILSLTVPDAKEAQHLAPALRECIDRYLEAAQCGKHEVLLLWPGSLADSTGGCNTLETA